MSVSVDNVVSTMLTSGGEMIVRENGKIASNLEIPSDVWGQWVPAHRALTLENHELFTMMMGNWVQKNGGEAKIGRLAKIMKDTDLLAVADAISKLGNPQTRITISKTPQPQSSTSTHLTNFNSNIFPFGVKEPIHKFVGRENERKMLNNYFIDQTQKCVVIYAIGGQGKTELCKKFIHDLITAGSSPPVVVWLPGESIPEFTSRVANLAHRLSIPTDDDLGKPLTLLCLLENVAMQIRTQFPNQRLLVVVDNVDEEYPELESIIQILIDFQAFVLITSSRNDIFPGVVIATPLKLETLSLSDAVLLVRNYLKNASIEDVTSLCDKLGNHALALQQSVAYIRMQIQINAWGDADGISHFLQKFQYCQKSILQFLQHPLKLVNYSHTIHAIVITALDSISTKYGKYGEIAIQLGIILGLVNPDGIHLNILEQLHNSLIKYRPAQIHVTPWSGLLCRVFGSGTDTTISTCALLTIKEIREGVLLLAKFSMVSVKNEIVSIHRLVQMVFRLEYQYGPTISILISRSTPERCSIEELRQLITIWERADYGNVRNHYHLAVRIFNRMFNLSLVLELYGFAEKNHTLFSRLFGPSHEITLMMEYSAARALCVIGDYEVALTRFLTLFEKVKRLESVSVSIYPLVPSTSCQISTVLWRLKRYEEALKWADKALKCSVEDTRTNNKSVTWQDFYRMQDTMTRMSNRALILADLGRMDEALSVHQRVLQWKEVEYGSSHQQTLLTRHNIACILFDQKYFDKARAEFETILKLKMEVLGKEHASTLNTKFRLASTIWELGRKDDAMKMLEEVLVSREKVLGPNHPHTKLTRNTISTWIKNQRGDIPSLEVN